MSWSDDEQSMESYFEELLTPQADIAEPKQAMTGQEQEESHEVDQDACEPM